MSGVEEHHTPITAEEIAHVFEEEEAPVDLSPYSVEDWVTLAVFWFMALCVFLQFFTRYVLNNSLAWTEEIATNCLIVVVFLGSVWCVRRSRHIQVDVLYHYLPRRRRPASLSTLVDLIRIVFFAYACWLLWRYVAIVAHERMVTVDLPRSHRLLQRLRRLRADAPPLHPGRLGELAPRLFRARAPRRLRQHRGLTPMALLIGSFLVLMLIGVPVAISMFVASGLYLLVYGVAPDIIMAQRMIAGVESFPLLAVPFFILAGNLMNIAGVTGRIYAFAVSLVGWMKGGLAQVNIIGSVIFSGMSGTALADAAGIGTIEIKAMKDHGYPIEAAVGVTAASATLGPIFPPSLPFVIYGMMANVSIGALFMAGILPGVVMTLLMMLTVAIFAARKGWGSDAPFDLRQLGEAALEIVIVLAFPVLIYLLILAGLSINVSALIALVVLCVARLALQLLRRHGADDAGHPDRRHDHGLVHPDRGRRRRGDLVALPRPRPLPLDDLQVAGQGGLRHHRDHRLRALHRHRRLGLRLAPHRQPGGAAHVRRHPRLHRQQVGVPDPGEHPGAGHRLLPRHHRRHHHHRARSCCRSPCASGSTRCTSASSSPST